MRFVIAALVCLAAAPVAQAASPTRGALYTASAPGVGSLTFTVSRDGTRVTNVIGREAVLRCPKQSETSTSDFDSSDGTSVRRGGTFRVRADAELDIDLKGRFGPRGTVSGTLRYRESTGCGGSVRFTGTVAPSRGGTSRRAFTLSTNGSDAFDLPGGAIGLQESENEGRVFLYTLHRVDLRGRDTAFADLSDNSAGDVIGLADGGVVYTRPNSGCIRLRSRAGKVTSLAGPCDSSTPVLRPYYIAPAANGYVFSDGGETGYGEDNTRIARLAPNGQVSPLAAVSGVDGGIAVERDGSVLVPSQNRVLRVSPAGVVTVAAGTGSPRFSGDGGPAVAAGMAPGSVVALPGGGFLFVDDSVDRIRQVSPTGTVTTFAGAGEAGTGAAGRGFATPGLGTLDLLRDGTLVFRDERGVEVMPGRGSKRLLVGLPAAPGRYRTLVRARKSVPVALTRRARVSVVITRGGRRVASLARTLPAGTTRVRVPSRARVRGKGRLAILVSARAGAARARDGLILP